MDVMNERDFAIFDFVYRTLYCNKFCMFIPAVCYQADLSHYLKLTNDLYLGLYLWYMNLKLPWFIGWKASYAVQQNHLN